MTDQRAAVRIDRQHDRATGEVCGVNGTVWLQCQPWRCELSTALELADQWQARAEAWEKAAEAVYAVAVELEAEVVRLRIEARTRQDSSSAVLSADSISGDSAQPEVS